MTTTADKIRALPDYDTGLLNDFGGGNVEWWQTYLRDEIGRANDHWREAAAALVEAEPPQAVRVKGLVWEDFADLEMIQNPHNSDDNLAIALCSYFEHRIDCPDGDEDGAELDEYGCWKVWASEHTESVLRRIAAKANAAIDLTPPPVDASQAPETVSKTPALDAMAMQRAWYTAGIRAAALRYRAGSGPDSWDYFALAEAAILDLLTFERVDPPLPSPAAALAEALQRPEVKALVEAAEAVIRDFHGDNAIGVAHLTKLRAALKG